MAEIIIVNTQPQTHMEKYKKIRIHIPALIKRIITFNKENISGQTYIQLSSSCSQNKTLMCAQNQCRLFSIIEKKRILFSVIEPKWFFKN